MIVNSFNIKKKLGNSSSLKIQEILRSVHIQKVVISFSGRREGMKPERSRTMKLKPNFNHNFFYKDVGLRLVKRIVCLPHFSSVSGKKMTVHYMSLAKQGREVILCKPRAFTLSFNLHSL